MSSYSHSTQLFSVWEVYQTTSVFYSRERFPMTLEQVRGSTCRSQYLLSRSQEHMSDYTQDTSQQHQQITVVPSLHAPLKSHGWVTVNLFQHFCARTWHGAHRVRAFMTWCAHSVDHEECDLAQDHFTSPNVCVFKPRRFPLANVSLVRLTLVSLQASILVKVQKLCSGYADLSVSPSVDWPVTNSLPYSQHQFIHNSLPNTHFQLHLPLIQLKHPLNSQQFLSYPYLTDILHLHLNLRSLKYITTVTINSNSLYNIHFQLHQPLIPLKHPKHLLNSHKSSSETPHTLTSLTYSNFPVASSPPCNCELQTTNYYRLLVPPCNCELQTTNCYRLLVPPCNCPVSSENFESRCLSVTNIWLLSLAGCNQSPRVHNSVPSNVCSIQNIPKACTKTICYATEIAGHVILKVTSSPCISTKIDAGGVESSGELH